MVTQKIKKNKTEKTNYSTKSESCLKMKSDSCVWEKLDSIFGRFGEHAYWLILDLTWIVEDLSQIK
jgi:hypothetical protein